MARKMTVELERLGAEGAWESVLADSATPAAIRQAKLLAREGATVRLTITAFVKPSQSDSETEIDESDSEPEVEAEVVQAPATRRRKAA